MAQPTFVGDGNADGEVLGRDGGKVYFYGDPDNMVAGAAQNASLSAIGTVTLSQIATSGKWGFASSTAGKRVISVLTSWQNWFDSANLIPKT